LQLIQHILWQLLFGHSSGGKKMPDQLITLPGLRMERLRRDIPEEMPFQHFHSHYELYYLLEGQRKYFINNKVYEIKAGAIIFIAPGNIHRTSWIGECAHERTLLEIDETRYRSLLDRLQGISLEALEEQNALVLQLESSDRARAEWLLTDLFNEAEAKRTAYSEYVLLRLEELLLLLLRMQSGLNIPAVDSEKHRKIYEIAGYISKSYSEIKSLNQLCGRYYMSKSHLCHIFKEVTGMTVQEYITVTRIKNARQLLAETKQPVTAVACAVGYSGITHFERMFKKHMGMTPLQYRASNSIKQQRA